MSRPRKSTRRFVIDTNVFVAAVKPFTKNPARKETTDTFALLIRLIADENIELSANARLVSEYRRLAEELGSPTSKLILEQLVKKMEMVEVEEKALRRCKPYLPEKETADMVHAATCLQTGAILITNDDDFRRIKNEGLIEVWSISDAIQRILK